MSCYIEAEFRFALGSEQTELSICARTEGHLLLVAGYREQIWDFFTSRTVCTSWATPTTPCVGSSLCHLLCCNSLLNELYVLELIFVIFLCNRCGCSCSPFWCCFGGCPSEVNRSSERLSYCSVHVVFSRLQLCCGSPGRDLEGQSPAVCGLARGAGGAEAPGSTFPASCHFGTALQPWDLRLPGSTETAPESCRGKGLKSFPFTLRKHTRNTWKRKGCQEWNAVGRRDSCLFCPPTEYNLFKYLHVLLLKDFPFFLVLFWLLSHEWWRWRDL